MTCGFKVAVTMIGLMTHTTSIYRWVASTALVAMLAACTSPAHRAPVENRTGAAQPKVQVPPQPPSQRPLPGTDNAGKPGYYTIKPGDTLIRIGLETGQSWRDLAAWNSIENPNRIEVGQVIRIIAPLGDMVVGAPSSAGAAGMVAAKPVTSPKVESRAIDGRSTSALPAVAAVPSGSTPPGMTASAPAAPVSSVPDAAARPEPKGSDEPAWIWPANGPTIAQFEEGKRKGLVIGGKAGDPVVAAGDGRVVYAGSGLRGYGNLVIIKHGGDYLTAYAHNQALLVKEDQAVRKGQKIAEMGATDAERVQLHFEIRKQGKPIDPARQLPAR